MDILLILHLSFVGIWLGCVLTEALFERAFLGSGRENEKILASLHKRVDLFVEIPAFIGVLVTGFMMFNSEALTTLLIVKIILGLIAIIANVYCVHLVFQRVTFAEKEMWQEFGEADHIQHKVGAIVLLGIIAALGVGLYF